MGSIGQNDYNVTINGIGSKRKRDKYGGSIQHYCQ